MEGRRREGKGGEGSGRGGGRKGAAMKIMRVSLSLPTYNSRVPVGVMYVRTYIQNALVVTDV